MIVCPSCSTRYRQPALVVPGAPARCTRCDDTFPLVVARRAYRVLDASLAFERLAPVAGGIAEPMLAGPAGQVPERIPAHVPLASPAPVPLPPWPATFASPPSATPGAMRELGWIVVTSLAGAVTGLCAMPVRATGPLSWTAAGTVIGLLFGWVCLRWNRRHSF